MLCQACRCCPLTNHHKTFCFVKQTDLGDLTLTFDYNLFGAPALTREELARHIPDNYAGLHFSLTTPTGSYDAGRDVNIGGNRWALKATLITVLQATVVSRGGASIRAYGSFQTTTSLAVAQRCRKSRYSGLRRITAATSPRANGSAPA